MRCLLASASCHSYLCTYHDHSDNYTNKNLLSAGVLFIRGKGFDVYFHVKTCLSDKQSPYVCVLSRAQPFRTPQTVAHQAPLSVGLPGQSTGAQSPFPPPGALPDPGTELSSPEPPALAVDSSPLSCLGRPAWTQEWRRLKRGRW